MAQFYKQLIEIVIAFASEIRRRISNHLQSLGQAMMLAGVTGMCVMLAGIVLDHVRRHIFPSQVRPKPRI